MWQINWSANQKVAEKHGATKIEDLLNLDLNAAVAYDLWSSSGFRPWRASSNSTYLKGGGPGWDPNGDEMWNTQQHQGEALSAVSTFPGTYPKSSTGDAVFDAMPSKHESMSGGGKSSSKTMNFTSSPTIHVAPVINFNGSPSTPDLRGIAQTVSRMLKEEISMLDLRTA